MKAPLPDRAAASVALLVLLAVTLPPLRTMMPPLPLSDATVRLLPPLLNVPPLMASGPEPMVAPESSCKLPALIVVPPE